MATDRRLEERSLSQFGLYVLALMRIYGVTAATIAKETGISKGTLSELIRPHPDRGWRPSEKTVARLYSYFYAQYMQSKQHYPVQKRVPAGWYLGMRNAALSNDLVPDILLMLLVEDYVNKAEDEEPFVLPEEISAYSSEELDELEELFVEGLAFIQSLRRRSRQHP